MLLVHGDNMNLHKQKEKAPEEKPAVVPKLGKKTIEERYALTVNAFIKSIEPRLKKDIDSLNKKTAAAFKKGDSDAYWTAVDEWLADNPDSPLQYVYLEDSFFDFKTGKLKLNEVKGEIKDYLIKKGTKDEPSYRDHFIANIMKAQTPTVKKGGLDYYVPKLHIAEDEPLQKVFALFFAEKTGVNHETKKLSGKKVPVVVTIEEEKVPKLEEEKEIKKHELIVFDFPTGLKVSKTGYTEKEA